MAHDERQLHLNAFLMAPGHHDAAWRHPASQPHRVTDITYFQQLAQTAERGKFDSIFFADGLALWGGRAGGNVSGGLEPLTVLPAIAVATRLIGLIATASTTLQRAVQPGAPVRFARPRLGGRAGWNIVTSGTATRPTISTWTST